MEGKKLLAFIIGLKYDRAICVVSNTVAVVGEYSCELIMIKIPA